MPHTDPISSDALKKIAQEIGLRVSETGLETLTANGTLELTASMEVWGLGLSALAEANKSLESLVFRTGSWHHQISHSGVAKEFARTEPGATADGWTVQDLTTSPIAAQIDAALDWVDRNVRTDPRVRLLVVPAYYLHALWLQDAGQDQILIADRPDQYRQILYENLYPSTDFVQLLAGLPPVSGLPLEPALI